MDQKPFRDRFCQFYSARDEDYEWRVLKLCLHTPWRYLARTMGFLLPRFFETDLQIVRQLGRANTRKNLSAEIRDIRADYIRNHDFGFTRRYLRRRLSSERLFRVTKLIWKDDPAVPVS